MQGKNMFLLKTDKKVIDIHSRGKALKCLINHRGETSYEEIIYTKNNPKNRKSCDSIMVLSMKISL